jgi:carbamoyltransferase
MTPGHPPLVLGINHGAHDAAAALFRGNELLVVVEQERLSRIKRAVSQSPAEAISYALRVAGVRPSEISAIALGSDHEKMLKVLGEAPTHPVTGQRLDDPAWMFPAELRSLPAQPPVLPVEHHRAHAASAFFPSGYQRAAIVVMDAMGEDCATSVWLGDGADLTELWTGPIASSFGYFFEAASEYAGLGRYGAGKLMGLAGYGSRLVDVGLRYERGQACWPAIPRSPVPGMAGIESDRQALIDYFAENVYPFASGCQDCMSYANFAASVQSAFERALLELLRTVQERTRCDALCLAGGVALNCSANGAVARSGLFDRLFVQPMAHDAGVSVGAALAVATERFGASCTQMTHAFLGGEESDDEILAALNDANDLNFVRTSSPDELAQLVAKSIADGAVVCWHQGPAEVGPRSLGARSLLGDPRSRRTLVKMNTIKRREMWRPLAPSVCAESFSDFFEGTPNSFMVVAARVKAGSQRRIPAVVHVDGTARPQVVNAEAAPLYYRLLRTFGEITGIPMLVNSSLNLNHEPICYSARDSIQTFRESLANLLALGPFVVTKR